MQNPPMNMLDLESTPTINVRTKLEKNPEQMNLSIRQAGQETGLSHDTLRYYERIGLLGPVTRNSGGHRRYNGGDIARLRFVRRARAMDFSLEEIAQLRDEWAQLISVCRASQSDCPIIARMDSRQEPAGEPS